METKGPFLFFYDLDKNERQKYLLNGKKTEKENIEI